MKKKMNKNNNKKKNNRNDKRTSRVKNVREQRNFSGSDSSKSRGYRKNNSREEYSRTYDRDIDTEEEMVYSRNQKDTIDDYVFGINTITELLDSDEDINKVWVQKGKRTTEINELIERLNEYKIPVLYIEKDEMDAKTNYMNNQGIMASVNPFRYVDVEDILEYANEKGEDPFVLVLDKVTDAQNLGAIIRSAEAAGVHGIIIPKRNSAQVTATTAKTSAGAIFHLKVAEVPNLTNVINDLKEKGLWIIGTDVDESTNMYYQANLKGPIAVVIGSEDRGLSRLVKENCDLLVKIPMIGKTQSLNASVSAGILVYEVIRQRLS